MKQFNVLSVCGSGTVTSSMVAGKLKEVLGNKGFLLLQQKLDQQKH